YARQHQVEHDYVVRVRAGVPEPLLAVGGCVDGETGLLQALSHGLAKRGVVFDQQDSHGVTLDRVGPRVERGFRGSCDCAASAGTSPRRLASWTLSPGRALISTTTGPRFLSIARSTPTYPRP